MWNGSATIPAAAGNAKYRSAQRRIQSKSGSAQRSKSIQHFGRFSTHWKRRKEIQKPWVFGGALFPISSAVGRNGAAGGIKSDPRRGGMATNTKGNGGGTLAPPYKSELKNITSTCPCLEQRTSAFQRKRKRRAQKKRDAGASLFSTLQRLWLCKKLTSARPCRRPPRPASS